MSTQTHPTDERTAPHQLPARLRLVVVDDEPLARLGLSSLFADADEVEIVGGADTVAEGQRLVARLAPRLVVTELGLGDEEGLGFIRWVVLEHPAVRVIALTWRDAEAYAERALKAGAMGFVSKREPLDVLIRAIREVAAGRLHVPAVVAQRIIASRITGARPVCGIEALSDRELQIFELMGRGACTHEIAEILRLSEKTVACHRSHIKEKLGLERLTDLLRNAVLWVESRGSAEVG